MILLNVIFISIFVSYGFGNLDEKLPFYPSQLLIYLLFFFSVIYALSSKKKVRLPVWYIVFIIFIILSILFSYSSFDNFAKKQLINMIVYPLAFYFYFYVNDVETIVKKYLNFSFVICVIGIIQELGYIIKFKYLYDFQIYGINMLFNVTGPFMRVTSIATEPSWFIYYILPAIYFSIGFLFDKTKYKNFITRKKVVVILVASMLSFSLNGYLAILILIISFLFRKSRVKKVRSNKLKVIILGIIFLFIMLNVPSIRERLSAINALKLSFQTQNLSVFAIISNYLIVKKSFFEHPIFGVGFFAHRFNYWSNIYNFYSPNQIYMYLNYVDASNMFFRIISEFGALGMALFIMYFVTYRVRDKEDISSLRIISNMAFLSVLIFSLRNGQYNTPTFWFFMVLYQSAFYSSKLKTQ
ncbi:O-antigen ligase family protein [Clostridium manihotivorum]|uniref:O-antigen ligase-related domain-containing protein n=1 Tax=Clostridium manihotivorum TaxID=2320868 RepID=A0A410E074_9CLOT|nr:O-antigen ligase family protein [Clostridium manihotivorum]QAA34711.1 hypothetical protein C1I91_25455 [Clostridium manihotivorum]